MEKGDILVLYKADYYEHGALLHVYSPDFGYLALSVKSFIFSDTSITQGAVQILSLLSATFSLPTPPYPIGELLSIESYTPLFKTQTDLPRSCIAIFICDILVQCLKKMPGDKSLYNYIASSLRTLNTTAELLYFPQLFLIGLATQLGFYPYGRYSTLTPVFNLNSGAFQTNTHYISQEFLPPPQAEIFDLLLHSPSSTMPPLTAEEREELLKGIIHYIALHQEISLESKTLDILHTILHT